MKPLRTIIPGIIVFALFGRALQFAVIVLIISCQSAFAQVNGLNDAEQSNVAAGIDTLKQLIADGRNHSPDKSQAAELDRIEKIYKNLKNKFENGALKSVPGLADTTAKKFEQLDSEGKKTPLSSAKGAYCSDRTYVKNDQTGKMDQCEKGDIIIDAALLNPANDTPIDATTFEGWTQLQELMDILAHEKMHDIVITENVDLWRERQREKEAAKAPREKTAEQKAEEEKQLAEEEKKIWWEGATVDKHKEVYAWQKIVVLWNTLNLKRQRSEIAKRLEDDNNELKPKIRKRNTLAKKLADKKKLLERAEGAKEKMAAKETPRKQAERTRRIEKLRKETENLESELAKLDDIASSEREMQKISEQIDDLDKKINWLIERHKFLEGRMRKATTGSQFLPWEKCGWPPRTTRGLLYVYLTEPGFYLRMDGVLARGKVTRASVGEMAWLGSIQSERPIGGTPKSVIVMALNVYTATQIQPDHCAYLKSATESGEIKVVNAKKVTGHLEAATGMTLPEQRPQHRRKHRAARPRGAEQGREAPRQNLDIAPLIEFGIGVGSEYLRRRDQHRSPQHEDHRGRD